MGTCGEVWLSRRAIIHTGSGGRDPQRYTTWSNKERQDNKEAPGTHPSVLSTVCGNSKEGHGTGSPQWRVPSAPMASITPVLQGQSVAGQKFSGDRRWSPWPAAPPKVTSLQTQTAPDPQAPSAESRLGISELVLEVLRKMCSVKL